MSKSYCMKCGYGNEFAISKPTKCGKCAASLNESVATYRSSSKDNVFERKPKVSEAYFDDTDGDESEFNTPLDFDIEPLSQSEIQDIFLYGANAGIKLKDIVGEQPENIKPIKDNELIKPVRKRRKTKES